MNSKNAIWIFGDQHRSQALSCHGDRNVNTPEIDRLAMEGIDFHRAVCGFPLCCPFRGSLLTSRYPHECVPGHEYPLPEGVPTIAQVFSEQGYETAYFGKWHLDGFHEREGRAAMHIVPPHRRSGFNTWIGYENNNSQWDCWIHGHQKTGEEVKHQRLHGYETDCLTDHLIDYIHHLASTQGERKPFFAVLSVQPPHDPYLAPAEYMQRHNPALLELRGNVPGIERIQKKARNELAGAYAQIENLDCNLGRIRQALAETSLDHETILMFFSDHGDMHGSHGQFRKTSPWEESIRIPFIIGGPPTLYGHGLGQVPYLINHVDIAPTTLGMCDLEVPEWMRGYDYSPLYNQNRKLENIPDSAFLQSVVPTYHGDSIDRPWRGIATVDGWKYVVVEHQPWLMFNLNEDPLEQVNLVYNPTFREKREQLHQRLKKWMTETGDRNFCISDSVRSQVF